MTAIIALSNQLPSRDQSLLSLKAPPGAPSAHSAVAAATGDDDGIVFFREKKVAQGHVSEIQPTAPIPLTRVPADAILDHVQETNR